MKSPFTGGKALLKREKAEITVRKEKVEIIYHYYLCEETNERFTNDEIDTINYNQINNKYREKHSFPFPDEIKSIRNKYGLSASKMSEVLGFGINMYRNYEAGELPSASNAKLILLAKDPKQFKKLIERSNAFERKALEKIIKKVNKKINDEKVFRFEMDLKKYLLGNLKPSSLTGYKRPSLKKLKEMVIYFSKELKPFKTALNKLLFYSDFLHYKNTGYSISGVNYRAINRGPVLNNFQSIFDYIRKSKEVIIEYSEYNENITEQFKPNEDRQFNPDVFEEEELNSLKKVSESFKLINNSNKIVELSHKEKAWTKNEKERKLIDYKYSFDLITIE